MDNETAMLTTLVINAVGKHGCSLKNIDFENHVLELEGPEDKKEACAMALAKIFD